MSLQSHTEPTSVVYLGYLSIRLRYPKYTTEMGSFLCIDNQVVTLTALSMKNSDDSFMSVELIMERRRPFSTADSPYF